MSNKVWKCFIRILILLAVSILVVFLFFMIKGSDGVLTGEEYLKVQEKYMSEFESYANDMDNIVTLYLDDNISEEDFLNHLSILQEELDIMKASHDKEAEKYTVITGSHTEQTKKGCEAVSECYDIFQEIITMMQNNYTDKDAMSYKYLAYHQDIINSLADYMTARDLTFGTDSEE